MDISKQSSFNDDISFMFHSNIVEYDMKAASLSISERFKLLDKETIEHMKLIPKQSRVREMGLKERDKEFSQTLHQHIIDVRNEFLEVNNISCDDILSTHNDAVIFKCNKPIINVVNGITFKLAATNIGYMKYNKNIEIFYSEDKCISFKQIPADLVKQHTIGINNLLLDVFDKIENYDESVLAYLSKFQRLYLQDKLPEYFYPPFGKMGAYKYENLKFLAFLANVVLKERRSWK